MKFKESWKKESWNLMAFLDVLKTLFKVGAPVASAVVTAYNPAIGKLVEISLNAIVAAESAVGPGNGNIKAGVAATLVNEKSALILSIFDIAHKPINDPGLFNEGLAEMQEGLVKILNATGEKPPVVETPKV